MPRRAHKIDKIQPYIVESLREIPGVSVDPDLAKLRGIGDILVGYQGGNYIFELKNDEKGKLTKDEIKFSENWCGQWDCVWQLKQIYDILGIESFGGKDDQLRRTRTKCTRGS